MGGEPLTRGRPGLDAMIIAPRHLPVPSPEQACLGVAAHGHVAVALAWGKNAGARVEQAFPCLA